MDVLRDLFAFVGRLGIAAVLIVHGLQKFLEWGIVGTARSYDQMGVPLPAVSAWYSALVELVGGAAMIIGLGLPLVGVLIAIDMAGALFIVHLPYGLIGPRGYELVLVLGAAALGLGFNGGRWAIDYALFGRRRAQTTGPRH